MLIINLMGKFFPELPTIRGYLRKENRRLNKLLSDGGMPSEYHHSEEYLFLRIYDLEKFAGNRNPYILHAWHEREREKYNSNVFELEESEVITVATLDGGDLFVSI
jgi:hypothetical protein